MFWNLILDLGAGGRKRREKRQKTCQKIKRESKIEELGLGVRKEGKELEKQN